MAVIVARALRLDGGDHREMVGGVELRAGTRRGHGLVVVDAHAGGYVDVVDALAVVFVHASGAIVQAAAGVADADGDFQRRGGGDLLVAPLPPREGAPGPSGVDPAA